MDSDRILVMDDGQVKVCSSAQDLRDFVFWTPIFLQEFDQPHNLLQNPNGLLSSLVEQTGPTMREKLAEIAKKAAETAKENATNN